MIRHIKLYGRRTHTRSNRQESPLLEVQGLKKWFLVKKGRFGKPDRYVKAVNGVDFSVRSDETLGVVGESSCGKSTMGRSVMRLIEPTSGKVLFDGGDFTALNQQELRKSAQRCRLSFRIPLHPWIRA